MKELTEARKLLGVDEEATRDEIIKRYDVILKKYKNTDEIDGVKLEDLYNAYNLLMGYDLSDKPEMQPEKPSSFSKFFAKLFKLDIKKVDNFFHYNKWKIVISIIALIIAGSVIKSMVTSVPADLFVSSIGQITIDDSVKVEETLKAMIPGLKSPEVEALVISGVYTNQGQQATPQPQQGQQSQQIQEQQNQQLQQNQQSEQDYAMLMKVTVMLAAGDFDLILVDKTNYETFAKQGTFETVEQISKDLGIVLPKDESLKIETNDGVTDIFGIDVTNSNFLKDNGFKGKKMIATIRVNAHHRDSALKVYKKIFETIKK